LVLKIGLKDWYISLKLRERIRKNNPDSIILKDFYERRRKARKAKKQKLRCKKSKKYEKYMKSLLERKERKFIRKSDF